MDTELVLVTGASGFIATHVISSLFAQNKFRVRGTVRDVADASKVSSLKRAFPKLELVAADLLSSDGWKEAVSGCTIVHHVASPFPASLPRDEQELIRPAVEGMQRILEACADCGTVKRVIVTSSTAAISNGVSGTDDKVYTEEDWTNPEEFNVSAYDKSKTFAEKTAWQFFEKNKKFELVVLNPVVVIGPLLVPRVSQSHEAVSVLLARKYPGIPNLGLPLVDVRDVAAAHIAAMTSEWANGKRIIIYGESLWSQEVAEILKEEFEPQGYSIPQMQFPNFFVWIAKWFFSTLEYVYPGLGKNFLFSNQRMTEELQIKPTPIKESVIDTAYSLIEMGIVEKKKGYQCRHS